MKAKDKIVERFLLKLSMEYMSFKMNVLIKMSDEIFGMAYEIDYMTRIYLILRDNIDFMPSYMIRKLYGRNDIIKELYTEWLKVDDSSEDELNAFVTGYFSKDKRIRKGA